MYMFTDSNGEQWDLYDEKTFITNFSSVSARNGNIGRPKCLLDFSVMMAESAEAHRDVEDRDTPEQSEQRAHRVQSVVDERGDGDDGPDKHDPGNQPVPILSGV